MKKRNARQRRWHLRLRSMSMSLLLYSFAHAASAADRIKADEEVVFFPTFGAFDEATQAWQLPVRGWIFEPEENDVPRWAALEAIETSLGLMQGSGEMTRQLFHDRVRFFFVDHERDKEIEIQLGGQNFTCRKSNPAGHFHGDLTLTADHANNLAIEGQLSFRALHSGDRAFIGEIRLVKPSGLSVISDIDDTIKISEVRDKRRLLARTFLEPHQAVPGMPELYKKLYDQGAEFHYVSASPWQLFTSLNAFRAEFDYPAGEWAMRELRLKPHQLADFVDSSEAFKLRAISGILKRYPQRQFVLVGDSGEKDPEVYGEIARKFPQQIQSVWIRNVTAEKANDVRFITAFHDVSRDEWKLFQETAELE